MQHIFLFLLSLTPLSLKAKNVIIVSGSSTLAPMISDLAKEYEKLKSTTRVDVQTGGSSRGILDIHNGTSNIGMVSRAIKEEEKAKVKNFTIAKDGLALIVNKKNSIRELSPIQVKDIYTKKITNWKQLGWEDKKIVVVNKAEGRSTLELFLKFFKIKNSQIMPDIIIGDNEHGIKTVSSIAHAIAYVSIGAAEYNKSIGVPLKLLSHKGVKASVENVENGSYRLTRELNLITSNQPKKHHLDFIGFVTSKRAYNKIREHFFVPSN